MTTCARCGVSIDGANVLYTGDGLVVCPRCSGHQEVYEQEQRVAGNVKSTGYSALAIGLCSVLFNPWLITSIAAISSGLYAARMIGSEESAAIHLAKQRQGILIASYAGIVVGAMTLGLGILQRAGVLALSASRGT